METYWGSVHDKAGVTCADCHMPKEKNKAGKTFTGHQVVRPKDHVKQSCLGCHPKSSAEEKLYQITTVQNYTKGRMREAEAAIGKLIDTYAKAKEKGVAEETLAKARKQHEIAHVLWEWWTAENSDGWHNPKLAQDSLFLAIVEANKGTAAAERRHRPAPAPAPAAAPPRPPSSGHSHQYPVVSGGAGMAPPLFLPIHSSLWTALWKEPCRQLQVSGAPGSVAICLEKSHDICVTFLAQPPARLTCADPCAIRKTPLKTDCYILRHKEIAMRITPPVNCTVRIGRLQVRDACRGTRCRPDAAERRPFLLHRLDPAGGALRPGERRAALPGTQGSRPRAHGIRLKKSSRSKAPRIFPACLPITATASRNGPAWSWTWCRWRPFSALPRRSQGARWSARPT